MDDKETSENLPTPPEETEPESVRSGFLLFLWDFFKVFAIAIAVIIPIRWFLFQPFVVTGDSMKPNFHDGNYLVIDELSYRLREPARGEVVVLRAPNSPNEFFIKRVVGLPGERIVVEDGHVRIYSEEHPEGAVLQESYLPNNNLTYGNVDTLLRKDEYFVLGDNRLSSSDSRFWGTLRRSEIIGRAVIRVFPVSEFTIFPTPQYEQ